MGHAKLKTIGLLICLSLLGLGLTAAAVTPFYAQYWVLGTINDASDGTPANGRQAIIHNAAKQGLACGYVSGNSIMINVLANQFIAPGTYYLSVPRQFTDDYGAGPQ
ncbi:MAG: hypothetical protein ABID35_03230, partial [Candidatus Margulisiibacteriota bacterium]